MPNNTQKGTQGEEIAVAHLLKNGYYIFWQKVIPHKVDGTDNKWVKRTQYQPPD